MTAAAAAERFVLTAICAIPASNPERVLPGLKPNQPNQRIKTPSATSVTLLNATQKSSINPIEMGIRGDRYCIN